MLFYECKLSYSCDSKSNLAKIMKEKGKRYWGDEIVQDMNDALSGDFESEKLAMLIYRLQPEYLSIVLLSISMKSLNTSEICQLIDNRLGKVCHLTSLTACSAKEITAAQANRLLEAAHSSNYITHRYDWNNGSLGYDYKDFDLNFFINSEFKIEEYILPTKRISEQKAANEAKRMMLDESFFEELSRIYSPENPREFYGHPIHYKITANNSQTAIQMAQLLCHTLYENKRLVSQRLTRLYEITEDCVNEVDLKNIFVQSAGSTIIIELQGYDERSDTISATHYVFVVKFLAKMVRQYQRNTLFIFVEITEKPGFSVNLLSELQDDIHIIEVKEGKGNRTQAMDYLKKLTKQEISMTYTQEELSEALGDKTTFLPSDIHAIYESLYRNVIRNKTYPAYKQATLLKVDKYDMKEKDALQTLNQMIGLEKVKELVKQIRDSAKVQKMRSDMGLNKQKNSLHMVFTGNPGSAKTTVARLLARILCQDGILESGNLIECGRADLVGQYVGWTAPNVRKQFRHAEGGILFIDEAYSLVDDRDGLYGDEAINAIVQEMENHRDDTIVIFAGYPEKMAGFINKNEGLRSRIAFYVDFPDYNAKELMGILELMAKDKGLAIGAAAKKKCLDIFSNACTQADFGNGRFVRNLLEQATMRQSSRIMKDYKGEKIGKKELSILTARDFAVNIAELYQKKEEKHIGFIA